MDKCKKIILSNKDKSFLKKFVTEKVDTKNAEWNGVDDRNRCKREMTGACVEYAILKLYGKEMDFDDEIVSVSKKKNHPDLQPIGIVCDIKSSFIENVPLIFKSIRSYTCNLPKLKGKQYKCANLIGITDHDTVWLLGIASVDVLTKYVDNNLIINSQNDTKTGFYGVNYLIDLPENWEDFKQLCFSLMKKV